MASPTPLEQINWDGTRGSIRWISRWTAGAPDNFTDQQLVDIDVDLTPSAAAVKIRSVDVHVNGNVQVTLEFDATTDQLIDAFEGQSDITNVFVRDYTDCPNAGFVPSNPSATGFTGDILLTTTGAADGDEVNLLLVFEKST